MNLSKNFKKQGFIHGPAVFSEKEVFEARRLIEDRFVMIQKEINSPFKRSLMPSEVISMPQVVKYCFSNKIVSALKEILGKNYYMFNDFNLQRNMFGVGGKGGWHVDSDSEGLSSYLHRNDYKFVKCGIYFQDNTEERGGGIKVTPGCHRFPIKTT